jgi:pSer/pThr/pTyr-binding forkhead associated (FHA) protein
VDLTELDSEFAASRRHAEIYREQGHHVLVALKTTNGTFLDGAELHPGERRTLRGGEVIQFGFQGVELMYVRGGGGVPASYFEG